MPKPRRKARPNKNKISHVSFVLMTSDQSHQKCTRKRQYHCKATAKEALGKLPVDVREGMSVYRCSLCRNFHLGHHR